MKKKLIILVSIIITTVLNISAISCYFPLVSGNYWEYLTETDYTYKYQVFTDTVIENKQYFKYGTSEKYPEYYFRWENSGKVYAYNNYASKEYLWFDFALNEGDTCFVNTGFDSYYAIVLSENLSVETEKGTFLNCKFIHFFSPDLTDSDTWYYFAPDIGIIKMSGAWLPLMSLADYKAELVTNSNSREQDFTIQTLNCYPNPFYNKIKISVDIENMTNSNINIYNQNGQLIENIYSGILGIGKHDFFWNALDIKSNIYFVALNNENNKISKKIILLK